MQQQAMPAVFSQAMGVDAAHGTGLSDCAAMYAKAISNPFGSFDNLPCVPMSPPTPTQRWKTTTRGVFVTGTAGFGFVSIAPFVSAKDTLKLFFTSGTFAGIVPSGPGVGVTGVADGQLPYTAASLGTGIVSRLVAVGVRVRNITQLLNVGGTLNIVQLDDQQTVNNFTFANLNALPDTTVVPQALGAQGDWTVLVWRPMGLSSLDFTPDDGVGANANPTMIVYAVAPSPGVVNSYEYEMVSFFEYQGQTAAVSPPNLVLSDADQVGIDRVLDASQRIPISPTPEEWQRQMAYGLVEAIAHSDSVARTIEDLIGGVVGGVFGGGKKGGGGLGGALGGILKTALSFLAL